MDTGHQDTDVTQFLDRAGVGFRAHAHTPVRNVYEAREAGLPFDSRLLTKTLVFRLPARWLLVWVRALDRIDYQALARAARENRRQIRFAADHEVKAVFGWEAGGAAPLPRAADVELVVDEAISRMRLVYCGGGRRDLTVELAPADLLARVPHTVAAVTRGPSGPSGP